MKKVKYFALVLILMLGLVGGAYAYWQDQVVVSGTISTAEFDIEWVVFQIRNGGGAWNDPNAPDARHVPPYVEANAWIDGSNSNQAWITISNLYPQGPLKEEVAIEGHMANNSTIPVKFKKATVEIDEVTKDLHNQLHVIVTLGILPLGDQPWQPIYYGANNSGPPFVGMPLTSLEAFLNDKLAGVVLQPEDHLTFGSETLYFYLPSDAPQSCADGEVSFTIELEFTQFNTP